MKFMPGTRYGARRNRISCLPGSITEERRPPITSNDETAKNIHCI